MSEVTRYDMWVKRQQINNTFLFGKLTFYSASAYPFIHSGFTIYSLRQILSIDFAILLLPIYCAWIVIIDSVIEKLMANVIVHNAIIKQTIIATTPHALSGANHLYPGRRGEGI